MSESARLPRPAGEERVKSGAFASASEVIRAAVRALDREETALNDWMRKRIAESMADPRPSIPAAKVFNELRAHHARRVKAEAKAKRDAKVRG